MLNIYINHWQYNKWVHGPLYSLCGTSRYGRTTHNAHNPYLVTYLIRIHIVEWFVVWFGSKNNFHKDMCSKYIGLCAQNLITINKLFDRLALRRLSLLCGTSRDGRTTHNVHNPYLVTCLIQIHIVEWYVVWCGSKNGNHKDTCSKETRLCAQNVITINTVTNQPYLPIIYFGLSRDGRTTHNTHNLYLVTYLIETPIVEWYAVWCGYKNGYQKDMCSKKIGLYA